MKRVALAGLLELRGDDRRLRVEVERPEGRAALVERGVVVAHAEERDLALGDAMPCEQRPQHGFVVAAVGDPDGFALQVLWTGERGAVWPVDPVQRVDLEELGQDDDRRPLGRGAQHLVGRGDAELGVAELELLQGVVLGAAWLDVHLQAVLPEIPLPFGVEVPDRAHVVQPLEPVAHLGDVRRLLPAAARRQRHDHPAEGQQVSHHPPCWFAQHNAPFTQHPNTPTRRSRDPICGGIKFEIRSPKPETILNVQKDNGPNKFAHGRQCLIGVLGIASFGFVSDFEFRASNFHCASMLKIYVLPILLTPA